MSRSAAIACVSACILLALGAEPTPARAQGVQAKTHVGGKPSRLVSLYAALSQGESGPAAVVTAEGGLVSPYVLPDGAVLVVTDMYAQGSGAAGPRFAVACSGSPCTAEAPLYLRWDTGQELSTSLTLTGGVVFRAPPEVSCLAASAGPCIVRLYGYLAKDK